MPTLLVSLVALLAPAVPVEPRQPDTAELIAALALAGEEREECLALALGLVLEGDCEGALALLDAALAPGVADELRARIELERTRLSAWIELRDAFLAELAAAGKPLAIELDGKKVSAAFKREGDELVLARGHRPRLSVRELAPEALLPAIPKERFAGANEWLKIYPYCVAANPKWKRLKTSTSASAELERDAEEFYPGMAALAPAARAIDGLARRAAPADRAGAEAILAEIASLLALGRDSDCVRARLPRLGALAEDLLARVAGALELGELVHAAVDSADDGTPRLVYDFTSEEQAQDWRREDGYLASLRAALPPVSADPAPPELPVGKDGFHASGEFCWRHALEFRAPMRVRYRVRWDPGASKAGKTFAFALGMLADAEERHVRVAELGFLYVDEQDGRYTAVRPSGNPIVQAGQVYALELAHDGAKAVASIGGEARAEAEAPGRKSGHVFLWSHSDLVISIPTLEIEGHPTPESLARVKREWARAELERLGLGPER